MSDTPVTWQVGQQVPGTGLGANGQYVQGVNIPVALSTGDQLTVFVPTTQYTGPDAVRAIIQAAVTQHQAVATLTGEV